MPGKLKEVLCNRNTFVFLWILLLSAGAGFINLVSMLVFDTSVSHYTGNISKLVINIYKQDSYGIKFFSILIFCFLLGSMFCGIIFVEKNYNPKRRYGILLMCCGLGYVFLIDSLARPRPVMYYLAFLLGVQNAMFINFRGMLVRTSHFTGYLTDAGFECGRILRAYTQGEWIDYRQSLYKVLFFSSNILGFCLGGFIGLKVQEIYKDDALYFVGWFYMLLGLYYFVMYYIKVFRTQE